MKIVKNLVQNKEPIYIVKMCGDYNDGDYSYSEEKFTESEFNEVSECLLEVNKLVGRDYFNGNYGYEDVDEHIRELKRKYKVDFDFPLGDSVLDYPIYSLESLEIEYIDIDGRIYDIVLED